MLNGDTINIVDKYGLKQGYWFWNDSNKYYTKGYMKDDEWKYHESISFQDSSKIKSVIVNYDYTASVNAYFNNNDLLDRCFIDNKDFEQETRFHPNGKLKKIRITVNKQDILDREYYDNGKLFRESIFNDEKNIVEKYYYDTGETMAFVYADYKKSFLPEYKWVCYNKKGKKVDKEKLITNGFIER